MFESAPIVEICGPPCKQLLQNFRAFIDQFKRRPYYHFLGGRLNGIAEPWQNICPLIIEKRFGTFRNSLFKSYLKPLSNKLQCRYPDLKWKCSNRRVTSLRVPFPILRYFPPIYKSHCFDSDFFLKVLGSLRYGDYGLRLRLNTLLRMIKTTWLFIFSA